MLSPESKCKCFKKKYKNYFIIKNRPAGTKYIHMFVSHINSPLCSFEEVFWDFSLYNSLTHSLSMDWNSTSPLSFLSNSPLHISYKFWICEQPLQPLLYKLQLNVIEGSTWFCHLL